MSLEIKEVWVVHRYSSGSDAFIIEADDGRVVARVPRLSDAVLIVDLHNAHNDKD